MPLIAPLSTTCCGTSDAKGRGARSTLIRGLRGLPPFDGKQFPRLPWGGKPVADDDIDRIETWIEEGCPGELIESVALAGEVSVATEARVEVKGLPGPVFGPASDPAAWRYAKGELRQRMDVDVLDDAQKERLRYAFRELYKLNKWVGDKRSYNNLALIHQNHCQHGWERFLPWHRVYLYEFEQALQDFCPDVTMPWWDFPADTLQAGRPGQRRDPARCLQGLSDRKTRRASCATRVSRPRSTRWSASSGPIRLRSTTRSARPAARTM